MTAMKSAVLPFSGPSHDEASAQLKTASVISTKSVDYHRHKDAATDHALY